MSSVIMSATMSDETDKKKPGESAPAEPNSAPARTIGPQYSSLVEYPKKSPGAEAEESRAVSKSEDSEDKEDKKDESGGDDGRTGAAAAANKKDSDKDDVINRKLEITSTEA